MKFLSWNVNGIRAVVQKGFGNFLKTTKPDFLCLQEIKISQEARAKTEFDFSGYQEFWHSARRPGYSGTAILVKDGIKVKSLPDLAGDMEGRIQTLDLSKYYLVNIYLPHSGHELLRLDFKIKFANKLSAYLRKLALKKPLIVCGDYNVAHQAIDLARPKDNEANAGFTLSERQWMGKFLEQGFIDTFRHLHPQKIQYSWWGYRFNLRARNIGWRVDYFCISKSLTKKITQAFILDKITGSDHAPVGLEIRD
jgi:exodeoxyribonuclease-3